MTDVSHRFVYLEPEGILILGDLSVLRNVHPRAQCAGEPCVIHSPSGHHMSTWRLLWRGDRGIFERICPHGIGHPDPDQVKFLSVIGDEGIHGCDGCCVRP